MTDTTGAGSAPTASAPGAEREIQPTTARGEASAWVARGAGAAAGAAMVVGLVAGIALAWRVVILVFLAVLLGSALEPLVGWLRGRLPIHRGVAILVVYLAFFIIVAIAMLVVVPASLNQAGALAAAAPQALDRAHAWASSLEPRVLTAEVQTLIDAARQALQPGPPPQAGQIVAAGLTVADAVVSVLTVLTLIYFWMTERARLQRFGLSFLPPDRRGGARDTWNDIELRLGGWVRGQLFLMASVGVMAGLACWILGLPSPLLLGLLAGLAEIIPMVGPPIGAIPALLVAGALRPEVVPLVIVAYVVIQVIEGNVLVPIVMRNVVGISPFVVIASLLIGGSLDGLRGALIAVPVAAAIEVVLERLQDREMPVSPTAEVAAPAGQTVDVADPQGRAPVV
jgi:predicted PurR-regulated permease PerM